MLRIANLEEIRALLIQLPALVRQQEGRSIDFLPNATAWLTSLEAVFVANRLYQAGQLATLRSGLVAAAQGQVPPELAFRGRPSRSRILNAAASQALQRAADIASALMAENAVRLAEGERVAQQIVAVALSRGLITAHSQEVSVSQYLRMLRRSLVSSGDLEGAVVHLEGLVGHQDALVLLDRALSPHLNVSPLAAIHSTMSPSPG